MDGEIKRFGLRTGKFKIGDNEMYERNRTFVCQFLMELYGFPISSERRTSAALFSRRLHKLGERFLVRVLGQSDRTITTIWNNGENRPYPRVEKIALVKLDPEQKDLIRACEEGGFFVDAEKRVVIIRISYKQHRYQCGQRAAGPCPFRRAAGTDPPAYGACDAGRECGQGYQYHDPAP